MTLVVLQLGRPCGMSNSQHFKVLCVYCEVFEVGSAGAMDTTSHGTCESYCCTIVQGCAHFCGLMTWLLEAAMC